MKRISLIISLIAFIFAITVSILPSNMKDNSISLNTILQKAIAEGEGGDILKWSSDIDCPDPYPGDYNECVYMGVGNDCSTPNAVTCVCGVSCL
ncbi:MAG: hypothetical protein NT144_13670 [Bacteroidia bacterium]|nr:hypothetical protein [Bacteroidia bacterium]